MFKTVTEKMDIPPPLATAYLGTRQVNLREVRNFKTPADLKGIKLRMPGSKDWLFLGDALGATATPLAFGEVYLGLKTGTIDGQDTPFPSVIYSGAFTPTEAATVAALHALILAGSFILNYGFTSEGVPQAIAQWVDGMHLSQLKFLLLVNVMFLVLGCFLDVLVLLLLFVTKALTGIPIGEMMKEGWPFLLMLLLLLLAMQGAPIWRCQSDGKGRTAPSLDRTVGRRSRVLHLHFQPLSLTK